jgi:hypothetical protein
VLSKTIQAWRIGKMGPEAHILALEYQRGSTGIEKNFVTACTLDGEAEGFIDVVEFQFVITWFFECSAGPWENLFRDLVDLLCCILDDNMEPSIYDVYQ